MMNNLRKNLKDHKLGILALAFLLLFQWGLYVAVVCQNENNLQPVRHEIEIDKFTSQDVVDNYKKECENEYSGLKLNVLGKGQYRFQTDSVEIVKNHFFDLNITSQLLLLSIFAVGLFIVFLCLGVHSAPFLVPLFIILTVSIFYHNYVGARIIDSVSIPIERVLCENCNDEYSKICKEEDENKCDCYYKIPDKYITTDKEGNQVKKLPIDKQKVREVVKEALAIGALKIYPENRAGKINLIELNLQNNPLPKESNINKYNRASADSKKHFKYICLGLILFFISIIAAKVFSKIEKISDKTFFVSIFVLSVIGVLIWVLFGKYAIAEFLKLAAILLTVIGYEKFDKYAEIKKHKIRICFWVYILILVIEMFILLALFDFGNLLILFLICLLVSFFTLVGEKSRKIHFIICLLLIAGIVFCCYYTDRNLEYLLQKVEEVPLLGEKLKEMHMLWRLPDTGNGLTEPLCKMTVKGKKGKNEEDVVDWSYSFYSQGERKELFREVCYKVNDENKKIGFYEVKNCKEKSEMECDVKTVKNCSFKNGKSQNCRPSINISERKKLFDKERCRIIDEICSEENEANETKDFYKVKNCKEKSEMKCDVVKECVLEEDKEESKDKKNIKCNAIEAEKEFDKSNCIDGLLDCDIVNMNSRQTLFAILKDGFSILPTGFKENTSLLKNNFMYTDFVFLGLIAFFGNIFTLLVVLCLGILVYNCNVNQKDCGDNYKHFLYSNIMVVIFGLQTIIHIGGNLNILPFTGVVLPFLSQGGASTAVSFVALGFALGGLVSEDSKLFKDIQSNFEKIRSKYNALRKNNGKH